MKLTQNERCLHSQAFARNQQKTRGTDGATETFQGPSGIISRLLMDYKMASALTGHSP